MPDKFNRSHRCCMGAVAPSTYRRSPTHDGCRKRTHPHSAAIIVDNYDSLHRPAQAGIRPSKQRVLRLMRAAELLAPARRPTTVNGNPHEGTIITEQPNQMWGTDATATVTLADGKVTVFAAIDHCTAECVGIHAVKRATRFEALEPIRQGVREQFGQFRDNVAAGLRLRHDHGSQYMS